MLEIESLKLDYPGFSACYDLAVSAGLLCAVIGPSGGGKTTLLHAMPALSSRASEPIELQRFLGLDGEA